ncbi:MAG: glycosyltransferase [Candidatus Cloacimonetes bacterium]|nr:glycosyltransferase [Candidatus Cloacimonadota bacterium]
MQINQFLPNLSYGDAIGNDVIEIRDFLIKKGFESHIYVNAACDKTKKYCKHYSQYKPNSKNRIIFHASIGSKMDDFLLKTKEKMILVYHNMTPAHYFKGISDVHYRLLNEGNDNIRRFVKRTAIAIGDSDFNSDDLRKMGFKQVHTVPIIVDYKKYDRTLNKILFDKLKDGFTNILFVSRVVPNKKHEDLLKTFFFYKKYINKKSRLIIVGNSEGMEAYQEKLNVLTENLNLKDVWFTGMVPFEDLATYYKTAHIFLSMSEHEGFFVPLLECMHLKVPILAYKSTAVPYTLGNSGVMFTEKRYNEVAELIDIVLKNKIKIVKGQNERLKYFNQKNIQDIFFKVIQKI